VKDVKVIFKEAKPRDPISVYPTVRIRAQIAGNVYCYSEELESEPSATEVCDAIQLLLDLLIEEEERINHEN
jgi:hypothetical protein